MGVPKKVETPEIMWELFEQYCAQVKTDAFVVADWVGGQGKEVERKKEKPLTLEGFENYCFRKGVINDLGHYFSNLNDAYVDFLPICARIRKVIRQDQIEGGMAGIYNPSITQRLNNLVDMKALDIKEQPFFD